MRNHMSRLQGKVALVTGANKGIGRAIARGLAAEGASVVLVARGMELLLEAASELTKHGAHVLAVPADVTDEAQVRQVFAETMERFGRVDILVNNAGAFDA